MPRELTPDLLKGVAVVLMIQVHLMEQFAAPEVYDGWAGKISLFLGGPFCAPVFLAVMGYFLASSTHPASYFLKRGVLLFAGGIALNAARSIHLLVRIAGGHSGLDPLPYILGADILILAGLSLAITGLLRRLLGQHIAAWSAMALLLPLGTLLIPQPAGTDTPFAYFAAFFLSSAPWAYFPVVPWYAYVVAGFVFRLILQKYPPPPSREIRRRFRQLIPLWAGLFVTLPWAVAVTADLEGPGGYYHHGILFFGWTLLFMATWVLLAHSVQLRYGSTLPVRLLVWAGRKVTALYAIQWLIIGNLAPWLYRSQGLLPLAGWFLAVTTVTYLAGRLYDRLRTRNPVY